MFNLKYTSGAIPGKPLKQPSNVNHKRKYEETRPVRKFNSEWLKNEQLGKWLEFDNIKNVMFCKICIQKYGSEVSIHKNLKNQNKFLTGCTNFRTSALSDHDSCKAHLTALQIETAKSMTPHEIRQSAAGIAVRKLREADRNRLTILFRNAHAIIKNNKSLRDYTWLCSLDIQKGIDVGSTYLNSKAALKFVAAISEAERLKTVNMLNSGVFSFMMDGSTDISGDEQEAMYIRFSQQGKVVEKFLGIGTPASTSAKNLQEFVIKMLDSYKIDKAKLVGMGSDGASNMVGVRGGLAALLREDVNHEMINVHCFAHRLELAFRDVLKKNKIYDKLMTLLIGLYYFYTKQYKNKKGLMNTMDAFKEKGLLPTKVTGTSRMAHLWRGIKVLIRTYKIFHAHLSNISHDNAKAEGLVKILLGKDLVCFMLFLFELLDPLMKLSLKLQRPESTVAECFLWVQGTKTLLNELSLSSSELESNILESGMYQDVRLRGNTPNVSYKVTIIQGFIQAIDNRFQLTDHAQNSVISATKLLHLKNWPEASSTDKQAFGNDEVKIVSEHFLGTLMEIIPDFDVDGAVTEWRMLKNILYERFGATLQSKTWSDFYKYYVEDFAQILRVIDILISIPPTSVSSETTFSQMKLIKTCRRTKLSSSTLNNLLILKMESPGVDSFDPDHAIDIWTESSVMPRRPHYNRKKLPGQTPMIEDSDEQLQNNIEHVEIIDDPDKFDISDDESTEIEQLDMLDELELNYKGEEDFSEDFVSEDNWDSVFSFARD